MYICIYVYMYTCIYVCIYIYISVCLYLYIYLTCCQLRLVLQLGFLRRGDFFLGGVPYIYICIHTHAYMVRHPFKEPKKGPEFIERLPTWEFPKIGVPLAYPK